MSHHRDIAILKSRKILKSDPLFLDTETTGLTQFDEIVEIGIVDVEGAIVYQTLVKPTCPISQGAYQVHHIHEHDLLDAPGFATVNDVLTDLLNGRTLVAYNSDFDIGKIRQSALAANCLKTNEAAHTAKIYCAMRLYASYYGDWNSYRHSYRYQSLENATRQCRITIPQNHRAVGDAELARRIILHMANQPTEAEEQTHA